MCPLISPARGALSSSIFCLIRECPVFHITGSRPDRLSSCGSTSEHFTSKMTGEPAPPHQVSREQHQQLVAEHRLPGFVHHADPVAVPLEPDPPLGPFPQPRP